MAKHGHAESVVFSPKRSSSLVEFVVSLSACSIIASAFAHSAQAGQA